MHCVPICIIMVYESVCSYKPNRAISMCHKTRDWTTTTAAAKLSDSQAVSCQLPSCQAKWQLPRPILPRAKPCLADVAAIVKKYHQEHSRKVGGKSADSIERLTD